MKTTLILSKEKKPPKNWPRLMRRKDAPGMVVLMLGMTKHGYGEGVVVFNNYPNPAMAKVGTFSTTWYLSSFEDFDGALEMSNDD